MEDEDEMTNIWISCIRTCGFHIFIISMWHLYETFLILENLHFNDFSCKPFFKNLLVS